jgi:2-phosphosulfolactate phosphatase
LRIRYNRFAVEFQNGHVGLKRQHLRGPTNHGSWLGSLRSMATSLAVHFLPALVSADELAAADVVMIDVLRASTTITHALAAGGTAVIPRREVEEARDAAARFPTGAVVLGGERGGLPITGFDFGNSPGEYTRATVEGKTVVFTTTNGTLALMQCRAAARVFIGSFVNLSAVLKRLTASRPIHFLCAGTRGQITREDVLCAGAFSELLLETAADSASMNDQARIAIDCWRAAVPHGARPPSAIAGELSLALHETQGGRNLMAIGLEHDIDAAAEVDRFDIVPQLDIANWRIVVA